jgi:hypothetical protein
MTIDDRLYLFRMNLQTTYIDDAVAPADEIIPIPSPLDDVACVNETVTGNKRWCIRAYVT